MSTEEKQSAEDQKPDPLREIVQPFIDLVRAPRALWGINAAYFLEGMVYFGMLMYLAMYFNEYVGLDDHMAGIMVGVLTSGITLSMFFFGGLADKWGVRVALLLAFVLMIVGRVSLSIGPTMGLPAAGLWSAVHLLAMFGILLVVLGYGMYQPAAYSAVRQFTTPKTAAMGFAMLYALMNLGGWLPSFFSPIRKAFGISGAYWVFTAATVVSLLLTFVILTKRVVDRTTAEVKAEKEAGKDEEEKKKDAEAQAKNEQEQQKLAAGSFCGKVRHWLTHHPLWDPKFSFFIFVLIPVQTLFAHNWLTLPLYVERAFRPPVAVEACESAPASTEAQAAREAAKPDDVEALKSVATKFEGTRPACEAKRQLRDLSKTEAKEGETLDAERAKVIDEAKRTIRTLDYLAADKEAASSGNFSDRLRLWIGENFEFAVNFNPLLIFVLVPIVTAVTQRRKVYNMMIIGTLVMAAPTFLLALGATFWTLLAYLLIMTVGEAMWQPRFLQYAAEIAPEGRTAAYMGVAQFPWFMTKMIVPLYSGYFVSKYIPEDGPANSEMMWLIYGFIACASTVGLLLAKGWVGKDFKTKHEG